MKTEGTSGSISAIRVRVADDSEMSNQPGSFDWTIRVRPDDPEESIPPSRVRRKWIKATKTWEYRISLPDEHSPQSFLVGRRTLLSEKATLEKPDNLAQIGLPNVPDADSQVAEVWIDANLQLGRHTNSLMGVPTLDSIDRGFNRYRYEADDQPSVEVMARQHVPPAGLVVDQRLRCIASVSGTDIIEMTCLAKINADLIVTFPARLHLARVKVDRETMNLTHQIRPGANGEIQVTIPSATDSTSVWKKIALEWISTSRSSRWCRTYAVPEIRLNEFVIDADQQISAASGTDIIRFGIGSPLTFFHRSNDNFTATNANDKNATVSAIQTHNQASTVLLLPTGVLGGLGWIASLMLLGIARLAGFQGIRIIVFGIVLAILAGLLWPTTLVALSTFVALPLSIAAMQMSTSKWLRNPPLEQADSPQDSNSDFSTSAAMRVGLMFVIWGGGVAAMAQSPTQKSENAIGSRLYPTE